MLVANEFHDLVLRCDPDQPCRFLSGNMYLALFFPDALDNGLRNALLTAALLVVTGLVAWPILALRSVRMLH